MAAYPTEPTYIMPQGTQVAYGDAMPAYTVDPGAYVSTMQGTPQMMYSSSPYSIPVGASSVQAVPPSVYTTSPYGLPSALDHSQGKWFAPGEALPPGFMVTAHPEGHTAPQETHAMSDLAPATKAHEQAETASTLSFMVRHVTLKKWLKRVYLAKLKDCTFTQFQVIVQNMLKCTIPEEALKEEIFLKCPLIPDDDKGELRAVADLGAALFAYTKHGLWPEALCQVARRVLPTGPIREYTLRNLDEAFAQSDTEKRGVLEAPEALQLLQALSKPGLTCSDMSHMLEQELGLHVPKHELQRYFAMMDINNDGVLQCDEFVQMVRFLMLDYYPHHVLKHLNLTLRQIAGFIMIVLLVIALVFFLVTLVVGLFNAGASLDSALHGGFVGTFGVIGKRLSDQGIGFEDTMQNLEVKLEAMLGSALVLVLGLSKEMEDVFLSLLKEVETVI